MPGATGHLEWSRCCPQFILDYDSFHSLAVPLVSSESRCKNEVLLYPASPESREMGSGQLCTLNYSVCWTPDGCPDHPGSFSTASPRTQLQSSEKSTMPSLEDVGRGGVWLGSEKRCYQHHKWAKRAERQEMVLPPSKTEEAQERLPGRRGRSQQADHGQDAHFS